MVKPTGAPKRSKGAKHVPPPQHSRGGKQIHEEKEKRRTQKVSPKKVRV